MTFISIFILLLLSCIMIIPKCALCVFLIFCRNKHFFSVMKTKEIYRYVYFLKCSAECGEGIQHRTVTCHRVNLYGWIDPTPTEGCPMDQRPVIEQICKLRECSDEYYWTAGAWKKVSSYFFKISEINVYSLSIFSIFLLCFLLYLFIFYFIL